MKILYIFLLLFVLSDSSQAFSMGTGTRSEEPVEVDSLVFYNGQNPAIVARQKKPPFVGCYQLISTGIDSAFSEVSGKNEMAVLMKDDTLVLLRDWNFIRDGYASTVATMKKEFPTYHVEENDYDVPYYFLMYSKLDSLCFEYEEDSAKSISLSDAIIRDTVFSYGPAKVGMDRQALGRNLGIDLSLFPSIRVIMLPNYYRFTLKKHPLKRTYFRWGFPSVDLYSIIVDDKVEQILITQEPNHIRPTFFTIHLL